MTERAHCQTIVALRSNAATAHSCVEMEQNHWNSLWIRPFTRWQICPRYDILYAYQGLCPVIGMTAKCDDSRKRDHKGRLFWPLQVRTPWKHNDRRFMKGSVIPNEISYRYFICFAEPLEITGLRALRKSLLHHYYTTGALVWQTVSAAWFRLWILLFSIISSLLKAVQIYAEDCRW